MAKSHCPVCGSHYIVAYITRVEVKRANGKVEELRAYSCRRCGERFNDDDRRNCRAPSKNRYPIPVHHEDSEPLGLDELFRQESLRKNRQ